VVEWDQAGRPPQTQRVMPYPNAHLVFEAGRTAIHGVVRGAFERVVTGAGRVFGVRFKPGGLRPFIDTPLAAPTDRTIRLNTPSGSHLAKRNSACSHSLTTWRWWRWPSRC
jgi:hypothetical protein